MSEDIKSINSCNLLISCMVRPAVFAVIRQHAEGGAGEDVHIVRDQLHISVLRDLVVVLKLASRYVTEYQL